MMAKKRRSCVQSTKTGNPVSDPQGQTPACASRVSSVRPCGADTGLPGLKHTPPPNPPQNARALRLLSQRDHSRLELARKLQRHAEEGDDVEALLNFLEQNK